MIVHAAHQRRALASTQQGLLLVGAGAAARGHGAAGDRARRVAQNEVFDLLDGEGAGVVLLDVGGVEAVGLGVGVRGLVLL